MEEIRNLLPSDFMKHVPSVAEDWLAETVSIRSVLPTLVEEPSDGIAIGRQSFLFAAADPFAMQAKALLLLVKLDLIDFNGLDPGSGFDVGRMKSNYLRAHAEMWGSHRLRLSCHATKDPEAGFLRPTHR